MLPLAAQVTSVPLSTVTKQYRPSNGLKLFKAKLVLIYLGVTDSFISCEPGPILPVHDTLLPTPCSGPVYMFFIVVSASTHGLHSAHFWKLFSSSKTVAAGAWITIFRST